MFSEGLVGGSEVGTINEGAERGADRDGVGSEVSGTNKFCSEVVVSWS